VNVANLYRRLATAIAQDSAATPDFATGVAMHEILDKLTASSETGAYQRFGGTNHETNHRERTG